MKWQKNAAGAAAGSAQDSSADSSPGLAQISGIVAGIVAAVALSIFAALCMHRRAAVRACAPAGLGATDSVPLSPCWMLVSRYYASVINLCQYQ